MLWDVLPYGFNLDLARRRLRKRLRGGQVMPEWAAIRPEFAHRVRPFRRRNWFRAGVRRSQLARLQSGIVTMRLENWAASGATHGLEYRYPLLDRRLLEFALGLPPEQFKRPEAQRWLMRHALSPQAPCAHSGAPVLPPQVCWRSPKADPARVDALYGALVGALPLIREEIAASPSPSRACYIDVPRLLEHLDLSRFEGAQPPLLRIFNAVNFLDFHQAPTQSQMG